MYYLLKCIHKNSIILPQIIAEEINKNDINKHYENTLSCYHTKQNGYFFYIADDYEIALIRYQTDMYQEIPKDLNEIKQLEIENQSFIRLFNKENKETNNLALYEQTIFILAASIMIFYFLI